MAAPEFQGHQGWYFFFFLSSDGHFIAFDCSNVSLPYVEGVASMLSCLYIQIDA